MDYFCRPMQAPNRRTLFSLLISVCIVSSCGGSSGGGQSTIIPDILIPDPSVGVSTGDLIVSGSITGNQGAVTLSLNAVEQTFSGSTFQFTQTFADGDSYIVQFAASESDQTCLVSRPGGVISTNVTDVLVTCSNPVVLLAYEDAQVSGHMATGDFNGDNRIDIAFSIVTSPVHPSGGGLNMLRVAFGDGQGAFANFSDTSTLGHSTDTKRGHLLLSENLNGDVFDDLVISSGNALQAFLGSGSGELQPSFTSPENSGTPLYSMDANHDGNRDFVSIIFGGSNLNFFNLYSGTGDGTFGAVDYIGDRDGATANSLILGSPVNFVVGDFNGDGFDDVLANSPASATAEAEPARALSLFRGRSDGGFDYPAALDFLSDDLYLGRQIFEQPFTEFTPIDYDADGDLDIAMSSTTTFMQLLSNDGSGQFTAAGRVTTGGGPFHIRAADFNNDGFVDLVSLNETSRTAVISFGDGTGTFGQDSADPASRRDIQFSGSVDLRDLAITDLNGDGFVDIIVAEDGPRSGAGRGSVQIVLGPGM